MEDTTASRKLVPAAPSCMFTGVSTPIHTTIESVIDESGIQRDAGGYCVASQCWRAL